MRHQLTVSEELWERYRGSGMEMREALWKAAIKPSVAPPAVEPDSGPEAPWGTLFITTKLTGCPLCQAELPPRTEAVMTSWTKFVDDTHSARGLAAAVHVECAVRHGIKVRWSVERILRDLRRSISSIENRELRRK